MVPKILLVNPAIYDFTAYDFWLKPYGLLSAGGLLRDSAELVLFDYLDRLHRALPAGSQQGGGDQWGRGKFVSKRIDKPAVFADIPRYYRRFGFDRGVFQRFLVDNGPFDFVLIQTVMTYWYPGVQEVIEDVRRISPAGEIVLGGPYASLCREHAYGLGAELVIAGGDLGPLWQLLGVTPTPDKYQSPLWEAYERLEVGVLKLSEGCPFKCTYCSVPKMYPQFKTRPLADCIADLDFLYGKGAKNIAFYDDSLLYQPKEVFGPLLEHVIEKQITVNFHTPNALHARFITEDVAKLMTQAGFKTFYLGFESSSQDWQKRTGGKVCSEDLAKAVGHLLGAGVDPVNITAYEIIGHPRSDIQRLRDSMQFANSLGIQIMLSDFSPVPGTEDSELCRRWVDIDEPLNHNKTAFPFRILGAEKVNEYKQLRHRLNRSIKTAHTDRLH